MHQYRSKALVLAAVVSLFVLLAADARAQVGPEFQVNTYTIDIQRYPAAAVDGDGDFILVWQSRQDGFLGGVFAQRFHVTGDTIGSEFQVNSFTQGYQGGPSVAVNESGDFVVVWQSYYGSIQVLGQRFDASGARLGSEFRVNEFTSDFNQNPSVSSDPSGNFVVVWDRDFDDVFGQRFDSSGARQGSEFQVNTFTGSDQGYPAVAIDGNGDFVVVWQSRLQDGSAESVFGQRFDNTGSKVGSEFQVNTYTTEVQQFPSVGMDGDGDFVVVWQSRFQDGSMNSVFGQRFDDAGSKVGSEFQVNTYTTEMQRYPSVAMDGDGDFVVAWESYGQDGSVRGVFGQQFDNTGSWVGSEFRVNSHTPGSQERAKVAANALGNFVITWQSSGQDGDRTGVFAAQLIGANLSVTKTANRTNVTVGETIAYTMVVSNAGPDPAGNVILTDVLASGFAFVSATSSQGACGETGGTVTCELGTIGVGADATVTLVVATLVPATFENTATATSDQYDPDGATGSAETVSATPFGPEFQVNTYTTGNQRNPSVAVDADGNFVIVWEETRGVFGQRFDPAGQRAGSEFQVNSDPGLDFYPSVIAQASGDFVVIWSDQSSNVRVGQRFSSSGDRLGSGFVVSSNKYYVPGVATSGSGDFVVAWHQGSIWGRRFDPSGVPVDSAFSISQSVHGACCFWSEPKVAATDAGSFFVVWSGRNGYPAPLDVMGRMFDPSGSPLGSEFRVNSSTADMMIFPDISSDGADNFVVVWGEEYSNVFGQRFDSSGSPLGSEFRVSSDTGAFGLGMDPSVAAEGDGKFIAVWSTGPSNNGVIGRRYDGAGNPIGAQFQISTYGFTHRVSIAANDGGNFVAAWESWSQDGDGSGIFAARLLSADLEITKTAEPPRVAAGDPVTYTITVRNAGPDDATNVSIEDVLPEGMVYVSGVTSQGPGCTETGGVVTCELGSIANGASATATIVVRTLRPGTFENVATARSDQTDTSGATGTSPAVLSAGSDIPAVDALGIALLAMLLATAGWWVARR